MTEIELVDDDLEYQADVSEDEMTEDAVGADMFEGDSGTLYPEQRRCLVALLKHRYISAERHPEQWEVLLKDEGLIKSRLNDMFLELQVERDQQIAFKRQAVTYTGDPLPSLLRERAHTKEETIVMLALRQRFFAQRQEGEDHVYVERETLMEEIAERWPEDLTNRSAAQKKAGTAIDGLATAGVLLKTADPDRFRISPIIEVLLPIEKLRELMTWLMTQNGTTPVDEDLEADELPIQPLDLYEEEA
ncbi:MULTISPECIES: DUF4194 domain-containing protein [Nocardioides]|uniref:DUF4194 domain-containing protein n=2 Tax=Nocardioides TaxID=1839 RepID=A0ABT8TWD8_9ACTN|nr:DUF4194 domain-containing protein [Nocardioides cremeus]MDO3397293.1 DUF4194 domain-containing protein [Nocardioides cremeus]